MLINNIILPLILTILLEGAVALVIGYRDLKSFLAVAAVNGITNPFINITVLLLLGLGLGKLFYWFVLPMELMLIPLEGMLLSYVMPNKQIKLLKLSACMNPISFIIGLIIF